MATRLAIRALLLCGGVVLAVGLAEVGLRMLGLAPPAGLHTVNQREFERIPGIFSPNQQVVERPGTPWEHTTTIDSLGYRGRDFPRRKEPGEFRLLFAGDSFTWGHNVEDEETTPARLEERLSDLCGPSRVVNAGLSGSTILGQARLVERGLVLDPDAVVVMFHENDMDELLDVRMWEQLAGNRELKSRFPISVVLPVLRNSALWNVLMDVSRTWRLQRGLPENPEPPTPSAEETSHRMDRARAEYGAIFESLQDTLAHRGVPFLYVAFPHPSSVREGRGGSGYEWVLEMARDADVPTLDLLPALQASEFSVEEMFLVPEDYHPSPTGHAVAAARIAEWIAGELELDSCSIRSASESG